MDDVRWGRDRKVHALIERGADVNAQGTDGETALMLAAGSGTLSIVRALLASRASAIIKDKAGRTALVHAEGLPDGTTRTEIIELLKTAGANRASPRN